jgi:hypothetical protein
MKFLKITAVIVLLLPMLVLAQKKTKKPVVPEVFEHARFVFVQAVDGEEFSPNIDPADRLAIADIRDALQSWGRYTLTVERDKADLIFVVRKGRLAEGRAGTDINGGPNAGRNGGGMGGLSGGPAGAMDDGPDTIGQSQGGQRGSQFPGQGRQGGVGTTAGVDAGPEGDLLQVCQLNPNNGKLSSPLWIHTFPNGLNAPRLILLAQLRDEVEKAYPQPPASAPAKP